MVFQVAPSSKLIKEPKPTVRNTKLFPILLIPMLYICIPAGSPELDELQVAPKSLET